MHRINKINEVVVCTLGDSWNCWEVSLKDLLCLLFANPVVIAWKYLEQRTTLWEKNWGNLKILEWRSYVILVSKWLYHTHWAEILVNFEINLMSVGFLLLCFIWSRSTLCWDNAAGGSMKIISVNVAIGLAIKNALNRIERKIRMAKWKVKDTTYMANELIN